jgi:hypothetical protein
LWIIYLFIYLFMRFFHTWKKKNWKN